MVLHRHLQCLRHIVIAAGDVGLSTISMFRRSVIWVLKNRQNHELEVGRMAAETSSRSLQKNLAAEIRSRRKQQKLAEVGGRSGQQKLAEVGRRS
jgi:hypothetical protein